MEQGLEFVVNDSKTVPCSARIDLDKCDYSRLYLYNETTGKWQYLNSYKDGVITLDTAGRYLLTNENLASPTSTGPSSSLAARCWWSLRWPTSRSRSVTGSGKPLFLIGNKDTARPL